MKKVSLKRMLYLMSIMLLTGMVMVSCKKDDDDDPDPDPDPVLVEDGIYLVGSATGFEGMVFDGSMLPGQEEGEGFASNPREGMFEKFMYLNAGTFHVGTKQGATEEKLGWDANGAQEMDLAGEDSQIYGKVFHGTVVNNGTEFNVATAGFYHVVYDKSTSKVYYVKIDSWGVIGDATDQGWDDEYNMPAKSLTATEATWEATEVAIRERGGFKFRYNNGWKINASDFVIFGNVGKGATESDWLMGGGTFAYPSTGEGAYTIALEWSLKDGWAFTATKTGDLDPLPEIEELFIVGTVNDWVPEAALYMIALDNAVFKGYQHLTADDMIKFLIERGSWAGNWGSPAAGTDGTITDNDNADVAVGQLAGFDGEGFYEIVADIANGTIAISKITTIGVIGSATAGGWDNSTPLDWDAENNVWTADVTFTEGDYKFRANDAWDINWGGDLTNLTLGGDNITSPGAGTYKVTLDLSGVDPFNAKVE